MQGLQDHFFWILKRDPMFSLTLPYNIELNFVVKCCIKPSKSYSNRVD